jgi:hypothetical protein
MLGKILFLFLVLCILNRKKKVVEGIRDAGNCCKSGGGFSPGDGTIPSNLIDSRCSSGHKYRGVKRCMGAFDTFDCGSKCNLCNYGAKEKNEKRTDRNKDPNIQTYGYCVPTLDGGYCRNNNEFKIYDTGEWTDVKKEDRGVDIRDDEHSKDIYKERFSQECNPFGKQDEYDEDEEEDEEYADEVAEEDEEGGDGDDLEIWGNDENNKSPNYIKIGLISSLITISMIGLVFGLYSGYKKRNIILFKMKELFQKLLLKLRN